MPKVPTLTGQQVEDTGGRVRIQTGISSQALGDTGGSVASAANKLAATTQKIFDEAKKKEQESQALKSDGVSSDIFTRRLHDKDTGALNTRGENGVNVAETTLEEADKEFSEYSSTIKDQEVRLAAERQYQRKRSAAFRQLVQHEAKQSDVVFEDNTKSSIKASQDEMIANVLDNENLSKNIEKQNIAIDAMVDRLGWPKEKADLFREKTISQSSTMVVNSLLSQNQDKKAKEYFEKNKDAFKGVDRTNVMNAIDEGSLRGDSQRKTDEIVAKDLTLQESLEKARAIKDPELRDRTVKRVKSRFQEKKAERQQLQDQIFSKSFNIAEQSLSTDDIPAAEWAQLKPSQKTAIENRIKQKRRGIEPQRDEQLYYDLQTMASSPATQEQFMKKNLMEVRHKLPQSDFDSLVKLQTGLRNREDKVQSQLDGIRSDNRVIDDTLLSVNISRKNDPQAYARIRTQIDSAVARYKEEKNIPATKNIPNVELQRIVDGLIAEAPGTGIFGFGRKQVFELEPGAEIEIDVDDIPRAEAEIIKNKLRQRGIPVTDDKVINIYSKKIQGLVRGR